MKAFIAFVCERLSLAVVAIGSIFMLLVFVTVEVTAPQIGDFGLTFHGNSNVVALDTGVKQGALQNGDAIDLASLTPKQRFTFVSARSNDTLDVTVIRGEQRFPVTLSAAPPEFTRSSMLARLIGIPICFFLSLGLASVLFLMRPRPATLAFYLYAILMLLKVYQTPLQLAVWPVNLLSYLLLQFVYPGTQIAALLVAQRLYGQPGRVAKWFLGAALATSVVVFFVWLDPVLWLTFQRYGLPGPTRLYQSVSDVMLLIIVLCGMAYSASGAKAQDRSRITWIVAGIALAPILDLTWAVSDVLSGFVRDQSFELLAIERWTDALAPWFGLVGIVAVFYGFLSQRVVDFRVAIGRAALYGATTLAIVVIFGAVEWLAEEIFESTRPAMYASLVVALAIGFAMRAMHGRIEGFLDNLFFRDQHKAEAVLRRAARALPNTTSEKTVVEFLIDEPVAALDLQSAALFLARGEERDFVRVAASGWENDHMDHFGAEDALVVTLRAELAPVQLEPRMLAGLRIPGEHKLYALVVPILMRANVFGFVFYGERKDGAPFTPQERELLATIATSAATAYDHIDADRARARIQTLEDRMRQAGIAPSPQ
jgi:hypothetical protein